jgi:hypothetical protein
MADLEMYRGDYIAFRGVAVLADDTDIYDLTGSKIYFTAKNVISDPDTAAVIAFDSDSDNIVFPDPLTGEYFIIIYPVDTTNMTLYQGPRVLVYDVQIKTADTPARVYTMDTGTITVKEDVTRRSD